ncbi:hypothetical protein HNQ93_003462 [Hymenobacter luteus]|uniref:DUF3037 domain-containing protein n=2 Tax=Hymenobacter TaxID=89966 RepID=A0A7W9T4I1_9BACT|nr:MULTISPECIES: DUF3037 domain-containing protein [Hymenobacter]MBB4602697.1 hypothetical protein [Hymenobacter latericoloratus]MBB6060588.1 hypothetical protein [Hymenobacter luteus]
MPEKHLFEYAVLRVVPRVEREEFLNVGVILYCSSRGFLQARFEVPEARLRAFAGETLDLDELAERLRSFERICGGRKEGGPIGQLPVASRFRWLTATRSTIVQTSPVHPGLCHDPADTLNHLYSQLVG